MDYCSSCRRHLNGALMCPGCGAYAPALAADIAALTADTRPAPAPTAPARTAEAATGTAAWEAVPWEAMDEAPRTDPSAGLQDVPPAPPGRAARRRKMARWKKTQRRALVATAVALVGGGLTVSAMDRHSPDRAQAATAPDTPSIPTSPAADEPTTPDTRSGAARPDTQRSSPARSGQSHATELQQGQSAAAPLRSTSTLPSAGSLPRTAHPASTTPATHAAATPAPQQHAGSASSGGAAAGHTGTSSQQTSAPASGNGTDPGTPQATPSPATPSSPELCLLVVCLG
ncbi:hypothetical protein [Streptomyces sp. NPDC020298]|uniref:SCO2400 family protein n=1 Tax=unclassified Streptomyces TaxID=2593676 RepID=UPI0033DD67CC